MIRPEAIPYVTLVRLPSRKNRNSRRLPSSCPLGETIADRLDAAYLRVVRNDEDTRDTKTTRNRGSPR